MSTKRTAHTPVKHRLMRGAAMIEFMCVLIPLLLLGTLSVELMHVNQARQVLSLALHQAIRAAITQHADPQVLSASFELNVSPLLVSKELQAKNLQHPKHFTRTEYQVAETKRWHLEKLSPTQADFADFAEPALSKKFRRPTIRNNFLVELHQEKLAAGWPSGKGPRSGHDVFEANGLALRLTYLHKPLLPGVSKIIRLLASSEDPLIEAGFRRGLFVIRLEQQAMMQSHPVLW